jgi:polysaccharide biosynthesis protein PelA
VTTRYALLATLLSLLPLTAACGGGTDALDCLRDGTPCAAAGTAGASGGASGGEFRGDGSRMPRFGGWAWGSVPADAVAKAGFDWFETGYPGDTQANEILRNAGVRPFAYINLGELHDDLRDAAGYSGAILRTNGDWGTYLVDVTHPSWQDWLVRRADEAYRTGSRGVKWDVATPDVPPGKTRGDVNDAIASVMQRILSQHPDMKFIFNQGFEFAIAYPQFAHGLETEGLFSASTYSGAWLQPWNDPWYWGPQFEQAKQVRDRGVPVFIAEYVDPWSSQARELYDAITAQGMVPYITSDHWNIRGWGYEVSPGW